MELTITALGKERMEKLIAFLFDLPPEKFDFNEIRVNTLECGTVGCALGWTPEVFPDIVQARPYSELGTRLLLSVKADNKFGYLPTNCFDSIGSILFGINQKIAGALFYPESQEVIGLPNLPIEANPTDVIFTLKMFLKLATVAN